ncbi:MAG: Fur family transcriptional regulator [Desulforhabdus sp.]|nr:Fur family transcriptional regulator [Desulforhabdus sp.]
MEGQNEKDFIGILREHGLQVTYQRLAIYQALYHTHEHPSAEAIYQQVRKRFPMISLGTVYKTLERFYGVGLIEKVSPVTDVARYDAVINPHHHAVCMKCQSIQDVMSPSLDENISLPEGESFHVLRKQVLFHGYCPECYSQDKLKDS